MAVTIFGFPKPTPIPQTILGTLGGLSKLNAQRQQNEYYPDVMNAKLALLGAQAKRENVLANLPYGGQFAPGVAGEVEGLEALRMKFGPNSPQYKNGLRAFNTKLGLQKARSAYFGSNVDLKYKPTAVKLKYAANKAREEGRLGDAQQYELGVIKSTTDSDARKRARFAANIDKSYAQIDPQALSQYAGLLGSLEKTGQAGLASVGKESKNYDNYQKSLTAANLLASQIRQFYGDSIQPAMIARLELLTNPASWKNNPNLALQNFYQIKNLLNKEMQTYRDSLANTNVYKGQKSAAPKVSRRTPSNIAENDPLGIR